MLDLSMGFGSMLVGHLNPEVVSEVRASLDVGTLYTAPSPSLLFYIFTFFFDSQLLFF